MDIGTIFGLLLGIGMFGIAVVLDEGVGSVSYFINLPALLFTFGGVLASLLVAYPIESVIRAGRAVKVVFKSSKMNEKVVIQRISEISTTSRKEGLLAIEDILVEQDSAFLKKGVMAIVDGRSVKFLENLLVKEITFKRARHDQVIGVYIKIGEIAPVWGLFGTVFALIMMFKNFSDISILSNSMAIALLSTMYGIFVANLLANPIANKLRLKSQQEMQIDEMVMEGLLAIHAGENTRLIEEKMRVHLDKASQSPIPKETISFGGEK